MPNPEELSNKNNIEKRESVDIENFFNPILFFGGQGIKLNYFRLKPKDL